MLGHMTLTVGVPPNPPVKVNRDLAIHILRSVEGMKVHLKT